MKIVTIIGARPQFVKAAIVSQALAKQGIDEVLVHTGQHYDNNMSQIFFDELEMPAPHFNLGVGSGLHGQQTGEMLIAIEKILVQEKPDTLLIYGDTNSTLAGALAAAKLHIPIAHVEAGLRSYNRRMPEEINRIVADQLSAILFTPTAQAVNNLMREGYDPDKIYTVGDVMYDAALFYARKAQNHSHILQTLDYQKDDYILATIHRAENTDDLTRLHTIFSALEKINQHKRVVLPLHPRTRNLLNKHFPTEFARSTIHFIEPIGFMDMVMLEKNAAMIMTDSGGVQKEAFFYGVPCVTLRDETEWVETVELGWNTLIKPVDVNRIASLALQCLNKQGQTGKYPFGKGDASLLIANHFVKQGMLACASG